MSTVSHLASTSPMQSSTDQSLPRAAQGHHRALSMATSTSSSRAATPSNSSSETPRPVVIVTRARRNRPRSTSSADLSLPPRYSQLSGTLPALPNATASTEDGHHIASDAGVVHPAAAAAAMRAQPTAMRDEREVPPLYGNLFPHRTRAERELDRRAERRRSRRLSGSANHLGANLAEAPHSGSGSRTPRARSRDRTTPPIEPRMHEYHLASSKGTNSPWATLRVFSQTSVSKPAGTDSSTSASSSGADGQQVLPRYTSNETVSGSLDLNLEAPMNVNSIQLSVRGRIVTSSWEGGSQTFIDMPILSWTRNGGDPRPKSILAHLEAAEARSCKKYDGKFTGKYSWPFSFPFPSEMEQSELGSSTFSIPPPPSRSSSSQSSSDSKGTGSGASTRFALPQTFSEREAKGSVQYELVLRMTHGILRSDSKLLVQIVYVPAVIPSPASALRQLAYAERMCVPGPEIDPTGWLQLAPAAVRGKLHNRSAKLICNLAIANPQSYTRGTVIPVNMSIESSDVQALDVLAAPKALSVRLTRRIAYFEDGAGANRGPTVSVAQGRQKVVVVSSLAPDTHNPTRRLVEQMTEMEKAVWWINVDVAEQEPHKRRLEGEIHLDRDMPTSCDFPLFHISYAVELFPFESSAWVCSKSSVSSVGNRTPETVVPKPLISHPIIIATLHGEGHAAVPYTKPKSRSSKKKPAKKPATSGSSTVPLVMGGFL
ncbi:hypothetical protein D9619_000548 [Psilocybe cf. subviscida]|uniref:Uncharacterized protein n=1 Tax=Psilocybe cf. subviscida TaxID=2480587 RepID=A0A8H5F2N7_9AGAR|nr:hypothetical protein D9619_000548 [Psilocybe cf. subviscida]